MTVTSIERYHDISCGHRVYGHESKCSGLHGHNYRITFLARGEELDSLGRVTDFGVLASKLCQWLEDNWDHRMLLWECDPLCKFREIGIVEGTTRAETLAVREAFAAFLPLSFNPTAENMAQHLLTVVGPIQLAGTGVYLAGVKVEETRKCSAIAELDN